MTDDALAENFEPLVDRLVGIVGAVGELADEADAPGFVHAFARTCDPGALGGAQGPFAITAAGLDRASAATAAVRAAIARYSAALYVRDDLPLATAREAGFPCVRPADFALHDAAQSAAPGFPYVSFDDDTPVRWSGAVDLATGRPVHVPAALVWFPFHYYRIAGDMPVAEPGPRGLACGNSAAEASLSGLLDIVAEDGAALFWLTGTPPPRLRAASLPANLRTVVKLFEATGDRVILLDVTSNNRIPSIVAAVQSDRPDRPAAAFAAAAHLDPAVAVLAALNAVAETRRAGEAIRRSRPPPAAANAWEDVVDREDHLAFAADPANQAAIAFLLTSDEHRDFNEAESTAVGAFDRDLEACRARIRATGHSAYVADLTSADVAPYGLSVCRVVVPGYQALSASHRARRLGGDRLYEALRKLGYRGIQRGGANSTPHPFG